MESLLNIIDTVAPGIRHNVISFIFEGRWDSEGRVEMDIEAFKKLLGPLPLAALEPYEKPLKKYLIFTEDVDGSVYIGKGLRSEVKKAIKAYFKAGGGEPDDEEGEFPVDLSGKGQYFNYVLERDSCDFYPTLSEAVSGSFETHMSRSVEVALEKLFLGKPLYLTEVGDLLFKLLQS